MQRIRKGNDFPITWLIERHGQLEDLTQATNVQLLMYVAGGSAKPIGYTIENKNVLTVKIEAEDIERVGIHNLKLSYKIPNAQFKGGMQDCTVDRNAFEIVATSAEADPVQQVALTSDMAIIMRGPKFNPEDFSNADWERIQRPAKEAATLADTAARGANDAATNANNKATLANTAASNADTATTAANTATQNADTATTAANNAAQNANSKATLAGQKAALADTAAREANDATSTLSTKISAVDTKMQQVDQKVTGYEDALNTKSQLVDTKIEEVSNATTDLETAVDNKIQAIETEATTWRQEEQSRKDAETVREGVYNSKLDKIDPVTGLEVRELIFSSHHYGVATRRWPINNASPIGEAVGDLETLRYLHKILGLGCYLVQKDHSRRKLDPTDHYKFADDGTPAALDGTMGDYMWGWNKKWYYATWREGDYEYEAASLKPIRGRKNYVIPIASTSALGVSVVDRDNLELVSVINDAPRYRGGNNNASRDGFFNTMLGRGASALPQETFGAYARKKGQGWEAYWYSFPAIIGALTRIILGTRHLQTAFNPNKDANGLYQGGLGNGVTDVSSTIWSERYGYYQFMPTSVGVELGDSCGEAPFEGIDDDGVSLFTTNVPVFFGLKNLFGYNWRQERGLIFDRAEGGIAKIYLSPRMWDDYSSNSIAGLTNVGTIPIDSGYIKELNMQNLCHKPISHGGSSTTFYADYYYNNNVAGLRASLVGGNANHGGFAGPECLRSNTAPSLAHASIGSPLCESQEDWDTTPIKVD